VTVGVFGSGEEPHWDLATEVGAMLAELGVNLLTGGGGGVMASVSAVFTQSVRTRGVCIGIVPCASEDDRGTAKRGYPNPFVELAIYTHLPLSGERGTDDLSRNHINVLSSTAIVALPGQAGTASEVSLAIRYRKPIVAYSHDPESIRDFPQAVPRAASIDDVKRFLRACL
jgi:uncharacterized protein (TIGR00725 family)